MIIAPKIICSINPNLIIIILCILYVCECSVYFHIEHARRGSAVQLYYSCQKDVNATYLHANTTTKIQRLMAVTKRLARNIQWILCTRPLQEFHWSSPSSRFLSLFGGRWAPENIPEKPTDKCSTTSWPNTHVNDNIIIIINMVRQ